MQQTGGIKCGIIGLPNVGKSTLFNALTKIGAPTENYAFCTIEPNVGIVPVPDKRISQLAQIVKPKRLQPTIMKFVDIAGLVKGAAQGEGLGNRFLSHIREVDAIAHVVRCFEQNDIIHVSGKPDPLTDIQTIYTELALADLEVAEKSLTRLSKSNDSAKKTKNLLERIIPELNQGRLLRYLNFTKEEQVLLRPYSFLSLKPILYIANISEKNNADNPLLNQLQTFATQEQTQAIPICAKLEEECNDLTLEEKQLFLKDLGLKETGLDRLIRASYDLLGLQTFFTAGVKEVRAWALRKQATASQAAGCIHSDFEKGFIRAEIISYDDFIFYKGEQGAKEAGKRRLEGKNYLVQDGDIIHFLFNV